MDSLDGQRNRDRWETSLVVLDLSVGQTVAEIERFFLNS